MSVKCQPWDTDVARTLIEGLTRRDGIAAEFGIVDCEMDGGRDGRSYEENGRYRGAPSAMGLRGNDRL